MTPIQDHLHPHAEPMPEWLAQAEPGGSFDLTAFFASRLVYYPGSDTDWHAIQTFAGAQAAHCFVQVDYFLERSELLERLQGEGVPIPVEDDFHERVRKALSDDNDLDPDEIRSLIRGSNEMLNYRPILSVDLTDQVRDRWPMDPPEAESWRQNGPHGREASYVLGVVLEARGIRRHPRPTRIAVLFLGTDGIQIYGTLFGEAGPTAGQAPYAVLLQDHGFGGNYDRFGRGGLLERIALAQRTLPNWLLVAANTGAWEGYSPVPGLPGEPGGWHNRERNLFIQ